MSSLYGQPYIVDIDFYEASRAWRANKKYKGYGCFTYRCIQKTKKGKACKRQACPELDFCKIHRS